MFIGSFFFDAGQARPGSYAAAQQGR